MLSNIALYSLISVLLISLISLIGIFFLSINLKKIKNMIILLISFAAGALLGDAFIHLIPELAESGLSLSLSVYILVGIIIFFSLEKALHWQHCHTTITEQNHVHPFAYINLVGDALHNFIDGIIITASYLISLPLGIATTLAVLFHEIPQELGDLSILLHAGFTRTKALAWNLISALTAVLGAIFTIYLTSLAANLEIYLTAIAAGGFIYLATADLIPEIHKHSEKLSQAFLQLLAFLTGIAIMALLLLLE